MRQIVLLLLAVFIISCGTGVHKRAGIFNLSDYDTMINFPTTFEKLNIEELLKEYPELRGRVMTAEQYMEEYEKELKRKLAEERPLYPEYRFVVNARFRIEVLGFLDDRELTRTYVVPPDGYINYYELGKVYVLGKTRQEVEAEIERRLKEYIIEPRVYIQLLGTPITYVQPWWPRIGVPEVTAPGIITTGRIAVFGPGVGGMFYYRAFPFTGQETLIDILSLAGLSRSADWRRIRIIRRAKEDPLRKGVIIFCDLWNYFALADMRQNIPLNPGDVIYVPAIWTAEAEFRRNLKLIVDYIGHAFSLDTFIDAFKEGGAFR